jgi:uncharacterized glyoxalase superfamily protein PhnB
MKINAVGVVSTNMAKTVAFYELLGFDFTNVDTKQDHVEPNPKPGSARLMIDSFKLITDILGHEPKPANHSSFGIEFATPQQVNQTCDKLAGAGFDVVKQPWDAFWGQRYAIVSDPDGHMIDLFSTL